MNPFDDNLYMRGSAGRAGLKWPSVSAPILQPLEIKAPAGKHHTGYEVLVIKATPPAELLQVRRKV